MSIRADKFTLYNWTKKERVIYLAKRDPFLKVERIAELAETSSHYVRTVLSEANLSLTKLRKEYAENKRRLDKEKFFLKELLNIEELDDLTLELELDEALIDDNYNYLKNSSDYQLAKTMLFQYDNQPSLLNTRLLTTKNSQGSLFQFQIRDDVEFRPTEFSISKASQSLSDLLGVSKGYPLLILKKEIVIDNEMSGVDIVYCNADKLQLVLEGESRENGFKLIPNN
ncbi:hypothetical protein JCM16358_11280 [Halanaerocella petrolearia]